MHDNITDVRNVMVLYPIQVFLLLPWYQNQ
jgi:hypothetical protein